MNPVIYPYNIDGNVLARVERFRDLGVIMTSDLQFHEDIVKMVNSAYSTLGFITRSCKIVHNP